MAERYARPVEQVCDADGTPMAGAKLYFFATNSLTPERIFSDPEQTIAAQNPQIADASGRFSKDIFISAENYRVQLMDKDGTLIWQFDNYRKNIVDNVGARSGAIWFFYGSEAELDVLLADGWYICDGNNDTPNLLDRFIKCSDSIGDIGSIGGSATVTPVGLLASHTLTTSEMPSHNHYDDIKTGCYANQANNTVGEFAGNIEFWGQYSGTIYENNTMPAYEVISAGGSGGHTHSITFNEVASLPLYKTLLPIIYLGE